MFKIKTPNENYNGVTFGVKFVSGIGETESEESKNVLVHDFGYLLVEETKEEPKHKTNAKKK